MMKHRVVVGLLVAAGLTAVVSSSCTNSSTGGEGEGERDDDDDDEGEGEGEGEGEEGEGNVGGEGEGDAPDPGEECDADNDNCGEGKVCAAVFTSPVGQPPLPPSCFVSCTEAGAACTTNINQPGTCQQISATSFVCLGEARNLAYCGNGANANCAAPSQCAIPPNDPETPGNDSLVGFCVITCDTAGVCMDETLSCSQDIRLTTAAGPVGVCAPPTEEGATCGPAATGFGVCTDGLACLAAAGMQNGTCGTPAEGEGEGEGQ
jgi:hypothetical protein